MNTTHRLYRKEECCFISFLLIVILTNNCIHDKKEEHPKKINSDFKNKIYLDIYNINQNINKYNEYFFCHMEIKTNKYRLELITKYKRYYNEILEDGNRCIDTITQKANNI